MDVTSADFAVRVWQGVVMGLALLAVIGGGFAMGSIEGVVVDDEHPPTDKSVDEGG